MYRIKRRPIWGRLDGGGSSGGGSSGGGDTIIIEKSSISGIEADTDFYLSAGNPQIIATTGSNWVRVTINSSTLPNSPRGSIVISKNPETGELVYSDNSIREIEVIQSMQIPHLSVYERVKRKISLANFIFEWDGMNLSVILNSQSDEYNGSYHIIVSTHL